MRRRPALETLALDSNPFGDEGLAALVAPPPADVPPPQAEVLVNLKWFHLANTKITDDGCAHLASRLRSGALPALDELYLQDIPASYAARAAMHEARPGLHVHGWDWVEEEEDDDDVEQEDEEQDEDEAGEAGEEGEA